MGKHWPWAITRSIILALSHYCGLDFHMENVKIVLDQKFSFFKKKKPLKIYKRNICLEKFQEIKTKEDTVKVKSHLLDFPPPPKSGDFKLYCAES